MDINKKICVICKKQITDDKEYVCAECYNKSLEALKDNELYQEMKKNNIPSWMMLSILAFTFMKYKE